MWQELSVEMGGRITLKDVGSEEVDGSKTLKKKKRKKRRRRKAKNRRSAEDEEQFADSGYTTAPEIRPSSLKPTGRAGRFTEDFSQHLEFGSVDWDEGVQRPWDSDLEKEPLKQEERDREEVAETGNKESNEDAVEDEELYLDPEMFTKGDNLGATIANLDCFTKNICEAEARLSAIRKQIEAEETAAANIASPESLHKTPRYFDNIIDKKASLLASIALLSFDNQYTLLEKRWGLVAERVSRGENRLACALADDYWDPYPISMLEALNEPSVCAKKLNAPKPRLKRDSTSCVESNLPSEIMLAQLKRLKAMSVKDVEARSNVDIEEEDEDEEDMGCWFSLFGETVSSLIPGI